MLIARYGQRQCRALIDYYNPLTSGYPTSSIVAPAIDCYVKVVFWIFWGVVLVLGCPAPGTSGEQKREAEEEGPHRLGKCGRGGFLGGLFASSLHSVIPSWIWNFPHAAHSMRRNQGSARLGIRSHFMRLSVFLVSTI